MRKHRLRIGMTCCDSCHTCHVFFAEALIHFLRLHPEVTFWQVPLCYSTLS